MKNFPNYSLNKNFGLFLDRDGVINEDFGYVYKISDFFIYKDAFELINYASQKKIPVFIVTNQSGIGRGFYSFEDFRLLNEYFLSKFSDEIRKNIFIGYCPHKPNQKCLCRKPKTYMFERLIKRKNIHFNKSIMVGDQLSDIFAAWKLKINNIYFLNRKSNFDEMNKLSYVVKNRVKTTNSLYEIINFLKNYQ